ncbi:MAG: hypoxanthine phosphoribosyltransferase [Flavobacteriales bacterium]|nr:hypoxanthine phosphoribosyltransferase [Flavobacteriales bacterium]MCB9446919.1 hypoxanthine phosphoribosyltransferase [Flavobacteriales bacterium]
MITTPNYIRLGDKQFELMITAEKIRERVAAMGHELVQLLGDERPVVLVVLKGAFVFAADLLRQLPYSLEVHFVQLSSYKGDRSSGRVKVPLPYGGEVAGQSFLIIEDIVDTGLTLSRLMEDLMSDGAVQVRVASFLCKPDVLKDRMRVDMVGFDIPPEFVVGYGLDYDEMGRHLAHVYKVADAGDMERL